ncbi:alpha/beta hydrolase fold domain-containing protein [Celeribacter arenosi]|uniref:Alpha/beta hydrolase n=1 Tax=Celeribacter arenosi TaxID=792649 RepID=A0ABP7K762_9RHOB
MTKLPDPALTSVAERFSAKTFIEDSKERMPDIRKAATEARRGLLGRHADIVTVTELDDRRLFMPDANSNPSTVVIYVHGGGWVNCDTFTHGAVMVDLAHLTGCEIIGPEYPLAPEDPYPAGLDHIVALVEDVAAARKGARIVLGGDSAGANLSVGAAAKLRDAGKDDLISDLLLWYGCFRKAFDTRSHRAYGGDEYGLTTEAMQRCWDWYLDGADAPYGDLSGIDVTGLPPAWFCEAELDCLADDSRWLAALYADAGIDHAYDFFADVNHGFNHFGQFYEPSYRSLASAAHFLNRPA